MNNTYIPISVKIKGFGRLFRIELPLFAGVCVIVGAMLALGHFPPVRVSIYGFLSVFFASAAALILNDYFDLETDRINAPDRPLPSEVVTQQEVLFLSALVTFLSFLFALMLGWQALVVVVVVWTAGFLYNWRLKHTGLPGNLLVSFSVGMIFIYGAVITCNPFEKIAWFFGILAALIDLGEEIAGDAADVEGDRATGSQSVAVQWGQAQALKVSSAIFLGVVLLSGAPFVFGWLGWIYALPLLLMDAGILISLPTLWQTKIARLGRAIRRIYLSASVAMLIFLLIRMLQ